MTSPVTVVVLTYNEERNLAAALDSVRNWAGQVFVVDSFSRDGTLEIAHQLEVPVYQNAWVDWAAQRNWALDTLPISTDWVFFLDADEVATSEFRHSVEQAIAQATTSVTALTIRQGFVFLGRTLVHAHEAAALVRVVRRGRVRWRCEGAREYAGVDGEVAHVAVRLHHEDRRGLTAWIDKQNQNSTREANALQNSSSHTAPADAGQERASRRWLQHTVWNRLPLFVRPWFYFFYIYAIRLGFLDGWQGFVFCFLHGLWYRMLIDAKWAEARLQVTGRNREGAEGRPA